MKEKGKPPVYSQVAFDLATKIATGDIKEGTRLSGRSLTSTQYGVSQETIRRAFKLLADRDIVGVQPSSGATVLSREMAVAYLEKFQATQDVGLLKKELQQLIRERDDLNEQILTILDRIVDLNDRFKNSDPLKNYEFEIPSESPLIGKTVGSCAFWQQTEGTVVALKRENNIMLSPGPNAVFALHDIIVVAGTPVVVKKVQALIAGTVVDEKAAEDTLHKEF